VRDGLAIEAVLLAGGEGKRLGRRKESVRLEGRTLLERHLDLWRPIFARVSVSARAPLATPLPAGVETILDPPGATSLLDVIAGLVGRVRGAFWLVAVDLPIVPEEIPRALAAAHRPGTSVFPEHERGLEMLCGLYDPSCRDALARLIETDDRALHRIAESSPSIRLRYPEEFPPLAGIAASLGPFFNVNTPEDLARLEAALAKVDDR
jgi:molybdopterin-guanine dinucleotide biosynthesis protein A